MPMKWGFPTNVYLYHPLGKRKVGTSPGLGSQGSCPPGLQDQHLECLLQVRNASRRSHKHRGSQMTPPVAPALAKVTIFEVAIRPRGWLVTSAEVNDRVYRVAGVAQAIGQ